MLGGCWPVAAADTRSRWQQSSLAPPLQDTQSDAAAPPRQKPLCPNRSTEKSLLPRRSFLLRGQATPPPLGIAAARGASSRQWPSSSRRRSSAPSPRWSSPPSPTTPYAPLPSPPPPP